MATAFPEWSANHRVCICCLEIVSVEEEQPADNRSTFHGEYQKFSAHPGECADKFRAATITERNELEDRLTNLRSDKRAALEQAAVDDGTYDEFPEPPAQPRPFFFPFTGVITQ